MIKPLDNYLVLEEKTETLTESGLVLTDNANLDKPNIATVIVCGPDVKRVEAGDEVLFLYHLFFEVTLEKKNYLIGKDDAIVALC